MLASASSETQEPPRRPNHHRRNQRQTNTRRTLLTPPITTVRFLTPRQPPISAVMCGPRSPGVLRFGGILREWYGRIMSPYVEVRE
jgi:hypothetical protein